MAYDKAKAAQQRNENLKEMQQTLESALHSYQENPELLAEAIRFQSKFYQYSPRNGMLIQAQNPHAAYVASYQKWKELGYQVQKGQHGMRILVPVTVSLLPDGTNPDGTQAYKRLKDATKEEQALVKSGAVTPIQRHTYAQGNVFDISQTDCPTQDYPKLFHMGYASEPHDQLYSQLTAYMQQQGVTVQELDVQSIRLRGQYSLDSNTIIISDKLADTQKLDTLIHEYGHSLMLQTPADIAKPHTLQEMEADAVSIMLQEHFGLPLTDSRKRHFAQHYTAALAESPDFSLTDSLKDVSDRYGGFRTQFDDWMQMHYTPSPSPEYTMVAFREQDGVYQARIRGEGTDQWSAIVQQGDDYYVSVGNEVDGTRQRIELTARQEAEVKQYLASDAEGATTTPDPNLQVVAFRAMGGVVQAHIRGDGVSEWRSITRKGDQYFVHTGAAASGLHYIELNEQQEAQMDLLLEEAPQYARGNMDIQALQEEDLRAVDDAVFNEPVAEAPALEAQPDPVPEPQPADAYLDATVIAGTAAAVAVPTVAAVTTYEIYQLKNEESTLGLRFEPHERLQTTGRRVDPANYDLVYAGQLAAGETLDTLYERFNIHHPTDFTGHSLSVSDIVVLEAGTTRTAHYVDNIGFQDVPEFLPPEPQQEAPHIPARLFVDMDGTLAEFHPVDTLEQLYEPGYFANLPPQETVVAGVRELMQTHPEIEVHVLSAVLTDSPHAQSEKNAWLDQHLPEIPLENRHYPPCGTDKTMCIPDGLHARDYLLDDYTSNLNTWYPPDCAIKLLNGINHTNGSWQHNRISMEHDGSDLAQGIADIIQRGELVQDVRPGLGQTESAQIEAEIAQDDVWRNTQLQSPNPALNIAYAAWGDSAPTLTLAATHQNDAVRFATVRGLLDSNVATMASISAEQRTSGMEALRTLAQDQSPAVQQLASFGLQAAEKSEYLTRAALDAYIQGNETVQIFIREHSLQDADIMLPSSQPGAETWSEPATAANAPEQVGVPSDDINVYLPLEKDVPMQRTSRGQQVYRPEASEAELQHLKEHIPITHVAQSLGYTPKPIGNMFTLAEHDSVRIYPETNSFYRYSAGVGGTTIDFVKHFGDMRTKDAIAYLKGQYLSGQADVTLQPAARAATPTPERKPFALPEKHDGRPSRVVAYLTQTRGIDLDVVQGRLHDKTLYEDNRHNAVFVGNDKDGKAAFATRRSTLSESSWRMDVAGSDQSVGWKVMHPGASKVYITEAPIDGMSLMSLHQAQGQSIQDAHYLSTCGTGKMKVVERFLAEHPQLTEVIAANDNDPAGKAANEKIMQLAQECVPGATVRELVPEGKDWNAVLVQQKNVSAPVGKTGTPHKTAAVEVGV